MRSEKGITLVALILIIVLLVVLAGISFAIVITNESDEEVSPTVENVVEENSVIEAEYEYVNNEVNEVMNTLAENL